MFPFWHKTIPEPEPPSWIEIMTSAVLVLNLLRVLLVILVRDTFIAPFLKYSGWNNEFVHFSTDCIIMEIARKLPDAVVRQLFMILGEICIAYVGIAGIIFILYAIHQVYTLMQTCSTPLLGVLCAIPHLFITMKSCSTATAAKLSSMACFFTLHTVPSVFILMRTFGTGLVAQLFGMACLFTFHAIPRFFVLLQTCSTAIVYPFSSIARTIALSTKFHLKKLLYSFSEEFHTHENMQNFQMDECEDENEDEPCPQECNDEIMIRRTRSGTVFARYHHDSCNRSDTPRPRFQDIFGNDEEDYTENRYQNIGGTRRRFNRSRDIFHGRNSYRSPRQDRPNFDVFR